MSLSEDARSSFLSENDPLFTDVSENFPEIFLDGPAPHLFSFADAPPFRKIKIAFETTAFETRLDFSEPLANGNIKMREVVELNIEKATFCAEQLQSLSHIWLTIWPEIQRNLFELRKEYGCDEPITQENIRLTLRPPNQEDKDRRCGLTLTKSDGYWDVHFNETGEILDSTVTF